ncbi:MAG TPA: extracellular solute-binding protein [Candidatus Thermoplasmatota archaeon]|nr:extracellular solute-binding protein [Candidatus Thermoplasmatota archaeon]
MARRDPTAGLALLLVVAATASAVDLHRIESHTLVVYTTPALRDVLEDHLIPRFEAATGIRVEPVYMSAGEEYYRVRLSRDRPEADVFLHASPLLIEKGYHEGHFLPIPDPALDVGDGNRSGEVPGGRVWIAFAWSPLVTVHASGRAAPDLAEEGLEWGLPHPLLSNNGVYASLFLETTDPEAGARAVANTVVQPTNARATIGGVADGSFDVTLGYEAVARFYQGLGAKVAFDVPRVAGVRATTPVLFSAGLVAHHPHEGAETLIAFLFTPEAQAGLAEFHLRPVDPAVPLPGGALSLDGAEVLEFDWADWKVFETELRRYEVTE